MGNISTGLYGSVPHPDAKYLHFNWLEAMQQQAHFDIPKDLPFLEAVCWDMGDVHELTPDEMLNRYERSWEYRGTLADVEGREKAFVRELAVAKGSWLQLDV